MKLEAMLRKSAEIQIHRVGVTNYVHWLIFFLVLYLDVRPILFS
jgi:hypothetical protein